MKDGSRWQGCKFTPAFLIQRGIREVHNKYFRKTGEAWGQGKSIL